MHGAHHLHGAMNMTRALRGNPQWIKVAGGALKMKPTLCHCPWKSSFVGESWLFFVI